MTNKKSSIDISFWSIIKVFAVVLGLVFVYYVRDVLAILFVALILAAALRPAVDNLQKYKIPRGLSVVFFFLLLFGVIAGMIALLLPAMQTELPLIAAHLPPAYAAKINELGSAVGELLAQGASWQNLAQSVSAVSATVAPLIAIMVSFFGGMVAFLVILVLTYYLVVEENALRRALMMIVPEPEVPFVSQVLTKMQDKISGWLRGQLLLSGIIGVAVYIALTILGVDYALMLALVAFIGEFIPYIGPILSAVPAFLVALSNGPLIAVLTLIMFVIIQQTENHILVPKVMQRAVGLNPLVSIIALLIGAQLAGFMGVLLAIPVATAISVLVNEVYDRVSAGKSTS